MLANNRYVMNERSNIIPIQNYISTCTIDSPTSKKNGSQNYNLHENLFDPTQSSPPNEFMLKLHIRMNNYNSSSLGTKTDNCNKA